MQKLFHRSAEVYFIGVTTVGAFILSIFVRWIKALGQPVPELQESERAGAEQ